MLNPKNHYWIIAGSTTDVYSSASNTTVPVTDATYVAWTANKVASPIVSEAELADVLKQYSFLPSWLFDASSFIQPTPTTYTQDQLNAYTVYSRWVKEQGGLTLSSGMPIKTDDRSQAKINGLAISVVDKATTVTANFHAADGQFYTLSEAAITTMSNELQAFIDQCFAVSSQTISGIAGGSVTTLAQIDAAFAAITRRTKK